MRYSSAALFAVLIVQVYSAPQFITFKEGKLGVNFGGYHAGVGLGGSLDGGTIGGLFAEAGTPHGQKARAGLGGSVDAEGRAAGGLYAGATAGGNVKAEAGLAGKVAPEEVAGDGYASAHAGGYHAVSGLAGETSVSGSSGITYSGTKSVYVPTTVVKETELSVVPVETVKHKKIHTEFNVDSLNEVNSVASGIEAEVHGQVKPTVIVKEVYVEPQPQIIEKHIVHTYTKPQHFHKTAYVGGYIGGSSDVEAQPVTVYETVQPVIERKVDVGSGYAGADAEAGAHFNGGAQTTYTKEVKISRNPTFFQDIFNIPISALKAVSSFLTNTAGSTSVSVQKSATIQESNPISPKHSSSSSSLSASEDHISVQTPSASQVIGDIFAIPINTLGAVNKFLENNVPARKRVRVSQDESGEPTRVRLGPHAKRRTNKHVVVVENSEDKTQ